MIIEITVAALGATAIYCLYKAWQTSRALAPMLSRAAPEELRPFEWSECDNDTTIHVTGATWKEFESLLKGSTNDRQAISTDGQGGKAV